MQLAKQAGARDRHRIGQEPAALRALRADEVIDYKAQRFELLDRDLDMVPDTVGGETRERSWRLLKPSGGLASLLPQVTKEAKARQYGVSAFMVHGHPSIDESMAEMTRRPTTGERQYPALAAVYPRREAAQALASCERSPPPAVSS